MQPLVTALSRPLRPTWETSILGNPAKTMKAVSNQLKPGWLENSTLGLGPAQIHGEHSCWHQFGVNPRKPNAAWAKSFGSTSILRKQSAYVQGESLGNKAAGATSWLPKSPVNEEQESWAQSLGQKKNRPSEIVCLKTAHHERFGLVTQ